MTLISVIIPVYNGAAYLEETVQSVVNQTYGNFELIIVDDGSTDDSHGIVGKFKDNRISYIRHPQNLGANAARNNGIRAALGELIAFLDQDDLYHPDKLASHVKFHLNCPDIGITYNAHYEYYYSSKIIREIVMPPQRVDLRDLLSGFPISPSEIVMKKEWIYDVGFWDDQGDYYGGEYSFLGKLFLAGCKFARVEGVLNYRRHHANRKIRDIKKGCNSEILNQEIVFADPIFPPENLSIRNSALSTTYLTWVFPAVVQDEKDLAVELYHRATQLNPALLEENQRRLSHFLMNSIADDTVSHENILRKVVEYLPINANEHDLTGTVNDGYLIKAIREVIWGRLENANNFFEEANNRRACLNEYVIGYLVNQLVSYSIEFGSEQTDKVIRDLDIYLSRIPGYCGWQSLKGRLRIDISFYNYQIGQYGLIPKGILEAVYFAPRYLRNRGVVSIFIKSIIMQLKLKNLYTVSLLAILLLSHVTVQSV